jgi:hypothetical protein
MQVDPLDLLERTMKQKTHFWKTFMMRGNQKCMVVIHQKGAGKDSEPEFVHPDNLNSSFKEIGAADRCQITLVELRGGANNDMDLDDEGGEEDMSDQFNEEGEEEQEEGNNATKKAEPTKIVEEVPDKKAADVLFEMEGDEDEDK